MNNKDVLDSSEDIIDNKLEFFSFFPIRFICYGVSLCGLYLMLAGGPGAILLGSVLFILTFPLAIVEKRITVDLTGNRYREYLSFWGLKTGKWQSFKGFKIITITHSDKNLKMNTMYGGAEAYSNSTDFYLNLKKDNYNKLNIASGNYQTIFNKALLLAHRYQIGIMDCSEKPNKKYDYSEIVEKYPDKTI
jgi:hypothetical protein